MAHTEIEPWAAKTLLLLRSSADNSMENMRTMLMETIHQKYNGRKQYKPIPPLSGPVSETIEKSKPREPKASSIDLKSKSISNTIPTTTSGGYSPTINLASPDSYASDSDNSSSENSEMVILDEEVTACAVCKDMKQTTWNQFIECSECHQFYHQQCHNPPISDSDVNDPRTVWYCRNCTKAVSKSAVKTSSNTSSSPSSKDSKSSSSSKPSSGRSNTSSPSFGSKTFGGGVSMSSKKSVSSKSSNSTSSKVAPNLNMVSADKRLQIMKKKAAKKQEKRPK